MKKALLFAFLLTAMGANAQNKKSGHPATVIAGHISSETNDSIRVTLFEQAVGNYTAGRQEFIIVAEKGNFHLTIPLQKEYSYVSLADINNVTFTLLYYLLKKGDSVFMTVNRDSLRLKFNTLVSGVTFSGRNCLSFETKMKADSIRVRNLQPFAVTPAVRNKYRTDVNFLVDSVFARKKQNMRVILQALDTLLPKADPLILSIIKSDYLFEALNSDYNIFNDVWTRSFQLRDSESNRVVLAKYFVDSLLHAEQRLHLSVAARQISKQYIEYLVSTLRIYEQISALQPLGGNIFTKLKLLDNEPVTIQEKALALYYLQASSGNLEDLDSLGRYTMQHVKDPDVFDLVERKYNGSLRGQQGFPFLLENMRGDMTSFTGFRGKRVLVDFWFTGCTACVSLERSLKKVKDYFKSDTSVVFVSVNLDTDKSTWKNSVKSGIYTDDQEINVFTANQGFSHELIKFYRITGCPKLLLFDTKGNLAMYAPTRADIANGIEKLKTEIGSTN